MSETIAGSVFTTTFTYDSFGRLRTYRHASTVVETLNYNEYSFDAWGRRRNPTDWSYNISGQPGLFTGRGFTNHEFLSQFKLYNMNGRMCSC